MAVTVGQGRGRGGASVVETVGIDPALDPDLWLDRHRPEQTSEF